jgi:hypothetical protein
VQLAAPGDTVGGHHRWPVQPTASRHLAVVQTPRIGG